MHKLFWPLAISLLVFLSFLVFYNGYNKNTGHLDFSLISKIFSFHDVDFSISELKKNAALTSLTLLSFAFLPGPLSKLNKRYKKFLSWRKPLGLAGFIFLVLHVIPNLNFLEEDWSTQEFIGILLGIIGFIIFLGMALTSNKQSVKKLTYKTWKKIQRIGYIALLLGLLHFVLLEYEEGVFKVRPFGYVALFIPSVTLLLKGYIMVKGEPERKKYEEHFS